MINPIPPINVIIPSNFNADVLIPPGYKISKHEKFKDGIHYFLDLLFPKPLQHKKRKQLQQSGYIFLKTQDLKKIIGPEYDDIITWLKVAGVIKVNLRYTIGGHSRGYRINQQYFTETVPVTITNKGMCKRYWKNMQEEITKRTAMLNKIPLVTKWLDKRYINIDLTEAHNFIETYRIKMLEKWEAYSFTSEVKKTEAKYRIQNRCYHQRFVVEKIQRGEINSSRDDAGRLYTPFVHLKKELRSFVTLDGKGLCSIDIKASQPYFFQKLLDKRFWMTGTGDPLILYRLYNERYFKLQGSGNRKEIIQILKNLEARYGTDLINIPFKRVNWENDFYEYLKSLVQDSTSDMNILDSFSDRGKVKKTVMLLLYDNYDRKKTPYYYAFKRLFPDETKIMDAIKKGHSKSLFPTILQAVEAKVVLESCCNAISVRYPELPFITIHDSVVCNALYADRVKEILKDKLHQSIGIIPGLKVELMNKQIVVQNIRQTVDEDWVDIVNDVKKMKEGPDWVGSFNEEPKEIPLLGHFKYNGRFLLEKRMAYPMFELDYSDYEENTVEIEYPEEYYTQLEEYG